MHFGLLAPLQVTADFPKTIAFVPFERDLDTGALSMLATTIKATLRVEHLGSYIG